MVRKSGIEMIREIATVLLIGILCGNLAFANPSTPISSNPAMRSAGQMALERPGQPAAEFGIRPATGEVLIDVKALGAINRPGVYHVQKATDLATFLALAGGASPNADVSSISILRVNGKAERQIQVDFEEYLQDDSQRIVLEAGDVVYVGKREPLISQDTVSVISLVASFLTVILSIIVVGEKI